MSFETVASFREYLDCLARKGTLRAYEPSWHAMRMANAMFRCAGAVSQSLNRSQNASLPRTRPNVTCNTWLASYPPKLLPASLSN